ncbi:hypothetical protein DM15PD_14050 [Aristophania vespae]|nr:AAA family ATPase [Aristophania vespae]UMM64391.1 hypothetical protein DM15PD_14050 [Aristophania vespae]
MLKSFMLLLNRAMPLLLLLFVVLAFIQLFIFLPVSWKHFGDILRFAIDRARFFFLPLALFLLSIVFIGYIYEVSSNRLARLGLRRRRGPLIRLLDFFTKRQVIDHKLSRQHKDARIDSGELAAALRARIIGQEKVCEDIAQQLKLRLALKKRTGPIGVFLFLGPTGTGKNLLAQQVAHQIERPCFFIDHNAEAGLISQIESILKRDAEAIIIIKEALKISSEEQDQLLSLWRGELSAARLSSSLSHQALFIFTQTIANSLSIDDLDLSTAEKRRMEGIKQAREIGIAPELTAYCDRIFLFQPLKDYDLARVSALAIEALIKRYGLHIEAGGIDPNIILPLIRQQREQDAEIATQDIVRLVEDKIGEALITMRQQGFSTVRLQEQEGQINVQNTSPEQERLTPNSSKG